MSDERLQQIETKLAFVEQTNNELSDLVYAQQQHLDRLETYCKTLAQRLTALSEDDGGDTPAGHEVPPHY